MKQVQLHIGVTLDEHAVGILTGLLRQAFSRIDGISDQIERERHEAHIRASEHAMFRGQQPPKGRGLLIDTKEVARLLDVSARTVWSMQVGKRLPKPIRIGRAVRWSYDDIKAWVNAGCPAPAE
jgi:predicted DNA-binding transcriptional regulator AlpA